MTMLVEQALPELNGKHTSRKLTASEGLMSDRTDGRRDWDGPTFEGCCWVDPLNVATDPDYQRRLDMRWARSIATNWDASKYTPIVVCRRGDGGLTVPDGAHRVSASIIRGYSRIPAIIRTNATQKDEALLFEGSNTAVKATTPIDRYYAECIAGNSVTLEIKAVLDSLGLTVPRTHSGHDRGGHLECIYRLKKIHSATGSDGVRTILTLVIDAWGTHKAAMNTDVIGGMFLFWRRCGKGCDRARLVSRLREEGLASISTRMRSWKANLGSAERCYALAFAETYNKKLRSGRLDIKALMD